NVQSARFRKIEHADDDVRQLFSQIILIGLAYRLNGLANLAHDQGELHERRINRLRIVVRPEAVVRRVCIGAVRQIVHIAESVTHADALLVACGVISTWVRWTKSVLCLYQFSIPMPSIIM